MNSNFQANRSTIPVNQSLGLTKDLIFVCEPTNQSILKDKNRQLSLISFYKWSKANKNKNNNPRIQRIFSRKVKLISL